MSTWEDINLSSFLTAPVFDKPLYNQTVEENGRATLKCYASGNPTPDITWYRNGKPIRNRSRSFILLKK